MGKKNGGTKDARLRRGLKAKMQRVHTKRRLSDRYDISANSVFLHDLRRCIWEQQFLFRVHLTNCRSFFLLEHEGQMFPVVYDKRRKNIATVLPMPYYIFGEVR